MGKVLVPVTFILVILILASFFLINKPKAEGPVNIRSGKVCEPGANVCMDLPKSPTL